MRKQTAVTRTALLLLGLAAAAVGLVACGSGGSNTATAATGTKVVSVKTVMGTRVFVNRRGKTLYSPIQERTGMIKCTGAHGCTSIWVPLKFSGSRAQLKSVNSGLGTIRRPNGTMQVAFHKKPLYSFSPEGPGKLTGNGVKDRFGSQRFTWKAVGPGGSSTGTTQSGGGGSYGGTYGGGGYGY